MDSWADRLAKQGYLTANGLVHYLEEIGSIKAVSYPTMRRMLYSGKIQCEKVGCQMRIPQAEIERFLTEGIREEGVKPSSSVLRLGSSPNQDNE